MKIKQLLVILILFNFPLLQNVFGQVQITIPEYIRQRFQSYCESVPREEIFIHTDREEYIAGEDLWFNIYLIDRQSFNPSLNSKIAYLELLDPGNKPVVQRRISIDNGSGQGQIELPDTLTTGTYTIRAYTSWMKNFLPYNCFIKDIKIYNAFRSGSFKNKVYVEDELKSETTNDSGVLKTNPLLTLAANNIKSDTLEIFVNADEKYLSDNNNLFYLVIQTQGKINHVGSERITDEHTKICVPKNILIPGINQITIFDFKVQPVCERYIYTPDNGKQALFIHSADSCSTRGKVSLELNIEDSMSAGLNSTNLSISVAPVTNRNRGMELNEYMIFGSEFGLLPGKIIKGKTIDELPRELIDSLLLNIESNWINWKTLLSDDLPSFKYKVEKEDHYLMGTILTSDRQLTYPGEFLLMSNPGKVPVFQYVTTDYEAMFSFCIHIDEEIKDLIIQPDDTTKNNKIYIESSFSDQYIPSEISVDSTKKQVPSYISKLSVNYQVGKIYGSSSFGDFLTSINLPLKPKRFYGKPDFELIMKDFIKLTTMEEVFFELIPHVTLKNNKSIYEISFVDISGNKIYEEDPVLMIDGVIIKDPSIIANLDPELVEKIDVVRERYYVGDYKFYGIVNVITKSGDYSSVTIPDYTVRLPYRVIDPVRVFVSPDYSSAEMKDSRTPDFRNTLYWNPSVKPDKNGKAGIEFWTSDITSDYEINIQGITSEGKTVTLRKIIKVR
jgi:hypothetical protein